MQCGLTKVAFRTVRTAAKGDSLSCPFMVRAGSGCVAGQRRPSFHAGIDVYPHPALHLVFSTLLSLPTHTFNPSINLSNAY
jgi:hypothetical protein